MATRRQFMKVSALMSGGLAVGATGAFGAGDGATISGKSLAFLKDMLSSPSPSGYEKPVQLIWSRYTEKFAKVHMDTHGNAIGVVNPGGKPRLMLAGHCDEIGFMVNYINSDGFIYFAAMGGFDQSIIPGRRVQIYTSSGPVDGVIGKGPIHLMSESDRNKSSQIKDLCIDIGAKDKEDAEKIVSIGDPIAYTYGFLELKNGIAVARAFDDRVGAFIVSEVLRSVSNSKSLKASVHGVSTVQEEIGLRGATTSAFGVDPQVGIAIDVTHATDYPGMSKTQAGDIKLGGGAVIARGPNINPRVFDLLVEVAKKNDIPYQVAAAPRPTGTDARAIQVTRAGVATGLISIPLRYMHTPVETLAMEDVASIIKLITAFAEALKPGTNLIP